MAVVTKLRSADVPLKDLLLQLWLSIDRSRKGQLIVLSLFMVLVSFLEVFSIGAVLPFLSVLIAPENVFQYPGLAGVYNYLGIKSPNELVTPIAFSFIVLIACSVGARLLLLAASLKLSFAIGADLSIDIYKRTLHQPYPIHLNRNSSEIIDAIINKVNIVIYNAVVPCITICSGILTLIVVSSTLLVFQPSVAVGIVLFGMVVYYFIFYLTKAKLQLNSKSIAESTTLLVKCLQEGLGNIRDVILDNCQKFYCDAYHATDKSLRKSQANNSLLSQAPRYVVEGAGSILIAIVAVFITKSPGGIVNSIPAMGMLVMGAQRLLPILQQMYFGASSLKGAQQSLSDVLILLRQPYVDCENQNSKCITFSESITFKNVAFKYSEKGLWILRDVNLMVRKGSRVGIVGQTGAGKSTFTDILMGLLSPTAGDLCVDGVPIVESNMASWQSRISHVPQSIFLSDATIAENIALGCSASEIDIFRVKKAAEKAQLSNTIEGLSSGFDTIVGERGARLSGGQRQRIGIARALYKESNVIILDEATSALDSATEKAVMETINSLDRDLTVFIIAHRTSTLKNCDFILNVADGNVKIENCQFNIGLV